MEALPLVTMVSTMDGTPSKGWLDLAATIPTITVGKSSPCSFKHVTTKDKRLNQRINAVLDKLEPSSWVLFLEADSIPPNGNWLVDLLDFVKSMENIALISLTTTCKGSIVSAGGSYDNEGNPVLNKHGEPISLTTEVTGWAPMRASLIKYSALAAVAPLHYDEEWETRISQELQRNGLQCLSVGIPVEVTEKVERKENTVCWAGPITDVSGYAAEGRLLVDWFPPEYKLDLTPIKWGTSTVRMTGADSRRLGKLVTQSQAPVIVEHMFPTHVQKTGQYVINRTMYETDNLDPGWAEALKLSDEIWSPSGFCTEVFSKYHPNVHTIPSPIDTNMFRPRVQGFGSLLYGNASKGIKGSNEVCRFLFFSEFIKRKGWRELCAAFNDAFTNEPVELVFKTFSSMGKTPEIIQEELNTRLKTPPRLISTVLTDYEISLLLNSCHCLVHPSHGEGFGRTVAEALACGIEAISIGETGLKEIQRNPIEGVYTTPVPKADYDEMWYSTSGDHKWYEIPHDALVEELRASYQRWVAGKKRTDRGWIIENFSGPVVSATMGKRLKSIFANLAVYGRGN